MICEEIIHLAPDPYVLARFGFPYKVSVVIQVKIQM